MPSMWRETKTFPLPFSASGGITSAFNLGGYSQVSIFVPVITSAILSFHVAPSGSPAQPGMTATDGPYLPVANQGGVLFTAATPGGTGGVAIGADVLAPLAGFAGPIRISAAAAQTGNPVLWVHLKG